MRTSTKLFLLFLLAGLAPLASAQTTSGNCVTGTAISFINVNDVQASLFNTGGLFFGGSTTSGDGYLVPKASGNSPIFASGVWVAGTVNGEPRVAAARYGGWDFWPGPIDENTGLPVNPSDCSEYDRLYNVTRQQIADYESGLPAARDLAEWPVDLGAPVVDGDGDPTNYNLAGGDRPEIIGDQGVWWVMNDAGNDHGTPLGIEIQALVWAFARADALGQTTFYRYRVINKGLNDIDGAYISIFSDPDLGDAGDDYVGVDTTLSLGFVYNDSNEDSNYGSPPPAAGYDFFQGPIVGDDTLGATAFSTFINGGPDGTQDPGTREEYFNYMRGLWGNGTPYYELNNGFEQPGAPITKFIYAGDPVTEEYYSEVNVDGNGTDSPSGDRRLVISTGPFTLERGVPQDIVFGVVFAQGSSNLNSVAALRAADVLAQTAYDVNFELAPPPPPPPVCNPNSPNPQLRPGSGNCLEAVEQDGQVTLVWGYPTSSPNYLGQFEVEDSLLADQDVDDSTYNFEGFNIYRYPTSNFAVDQRELVATYDKANGVTTVIDQVNDPDVGGLVPAVVARGTDSGLQYVFDIQNLTNNTDYYYGVTAYSYNEESTPKVIESSASQITVRPARLQSGALVQSELGEVFMADAASSNIGEGRVSVSVVDPTVVTGNDYRVEFYEAECADAPRSSEKKAGEKIPGQRRTASRQVQTLTVYNIINATTGEVKFDGAEYCQRTGLAPAQGNNLFVIDGLQFNVDGPAPTLTQFLVTANADGPIDPPFTGGSADFQSYPVPARPSVNGDANGIPQQIDADDSFTGAAWFIGPNEIFGGHTFGDFLNNTDLDLAVPYDWEIRFPEGGSEAPMVFTGALYGPNTDTPSPVVSVPFELWRIGIATPDDPSDDIQYVPLLIDIDGAVGDDVHPGDGVFNMYTDVTLNAGYYGQTFGLTDADSKMSSAFNDPSSDSWDWHEPIGGIGVGSYDDTIARFKADPATARGELLATNSPFVVNSLIAWNGGATCPDGDDEDTEPDQDEDGVCTNPDVEYGLFEFPEPGTVFRIISAKPNLPGDQFTFSTEGAEFMPATAETTEAELDRIAMVPNPYMGESDYETGNLSRVVRITNLPAEATTIQIYTVAGTLVRTLRKEGPSRSLDWDLQTQNNLPVASGMYLVRVEVDGVGERIMKFGMVNRRSRITLF